jgi:hypothetical protein
VLSLEAVHWLTLFSSGIAEYHKLSNLGRTEMYLLTILQEEKSKLEWAAFGRAFLLQLHEVKGRMKGKNCQILVLL